MFCCKSSKRYYQWRKAVFKRDLFTCKQCGAKGNKAKLEADHIYPFSALLQDNRIKELKQALTCEALWDINNGRTLCKSCHKKTDTYQNGAKKYIQTGY